MPPRKKDDATQQGAPADEQQEVAAAQDEQQQYRSPRDEAMERMAQSRREALAQDGVAVSDEPDEDKGQADDVTAQVEEIPAAENAAEVDDLGADAQVAEQLKPNVIADGFDKVRVRAKVDGEEMEVSLDQVLRQFQKNSAADRRLAEASRILAEAQQRAQTGKEDAPEKDPRSEDDKKASRDAAKRITSALMSGDEEAATEIMAELLEGRGDRQAPAIPSVDQITAQVKQQIEIESALQKFGTDYADINSQPHLAPALENLVEQKVQGGMAFPDALNEAGAELRGWLQSLVGAAAEPAATTSRNERLERKARADNVRGASVTAASPNSAEPKTEEQLRAEALAELRKSRPGQG